MRVLIVRLSSMGDVVHTLPALTDAVRAIPSIRFDWAVDEAFAEIPAWHSAVETIFPVALRRWRGDLASAAGRDRVRAFLKKLRANHYDSIVDLQGEFKSSLIGRLAKGARAGYDGASAREWGAQVTYQKKIEVPKGTHSMARMRQLLSRALSYSYEEQSIDYGIARDRLPSPLRLKGPYVVFIHSTSWESKNWPESYWRDLADKVNAAGLSIVLPWGSESERERSETIAAGHQSRVVLPRMSIAEKAAIIGAATATVGLDTGLSHIAAALGVPSVTLYGATDPGRCGTIGERQIHLASDFECVRCHETKCSFTGSAFKPACFEKVEPNRVWKELETLMAASTTAPARTYQLA